MSLQPLPFDWIEEIQHEIFTLTEAPMLPPSPPFPKELFIQQLVEKLGLQASLEIGTPQVISREVLEKQLSPSTTRLFSFSLSPHTHCFYLAAGHEELSKLAGMLLEQDFTAAVSMQGTLQESFYLFIAAAAIDAVQGSGYVKNNPLRLLSTGAHLKEPAAMLSISLSLSCKGVTLAFLLLIPKELQQELKKITREEEALLVQQTAATSGVQLVARLVLELVMLSYQEASSLKAGSLLLLHKASAVEPFDVQLVIGKRAFFSAKAHGQKLSITGLAEPLEEIKIMDKPQEPAVAKEPLTSKEPPAEKKPAAAAPAQEPSAENPSYFLGEDEEFFVEDEELSKVIQEEKAAATSTAPATASPTKAPLEKPSIEKEPTETHLTEVPLQIEVVAGYLRLSVKDLLEMHAGGSYTLGSPVSAQVDLLLNGKRIAKGELLKSGDLLGVRILSL